MTVVCLIIANIVIILIVSHEISFGLFVCGYRCEKVKTSDNSGFYNLL